MRAKKSKSKPSSRLRGGVSFVPGFAIQHKPFKFHSELRGSVTMGKLLGEHTKDDAISLGVEFVKLGWAVKSCSLGARFALRRGEYP